MDITLEFCRKCLLWPYADVSPAWPNLVFEDLDPSIKANTFDFTDTDGRCYPVAATRLLHGPLGSSREVICSDGRDRSVQPPKTLTDHPVQDFDIRGDHGSVRRSLVYAA